ncbi:MAG: GTPase Era [Chloroflexi bacterium]|nr:MAG: GTPase Era [Chloroflexota bacterium]HDN79138.1 GTPase Era [Chloroflexota bacterium]
MLDEAALLPAEEELPEDHRSGFVAVIGKPNVGKSTLMNAYLGQKVAIVSPKPQTTRHRIRGILTLPNAQIIFVDTPGIHKPLHKLGEYMVKTAVAAIVDADVVLFLVDVSQMPDEEDELIAQTLKKRYKGPVILVLNKMDLLKPEQVKPHTEAYLALGDFQEWMMVSAVTGDNLDKLRDLIVSFLPPGPRFYPKEQITDVNERFIAAELIREKALHFLRQEVPHSVAVVIEEFKDRSPDFSYISATIYVEKESQKAIVIGKNGQMLKKIGQAARREIELALGRRVYLELWVKVRKKWRRDEQELRRMGYVAPKV